MDARAQTAVDFGIAVGIFLVAVTVVVAFLPQMIEPFSGTPTSNPLMADRAANQLVDFQLSGQGSGVLDATCTLYFFSDDSQPGSNPCPSFESDGTTVNERLGIDDTVRINVTVEQNVTGGSATEVLCGDLSAEEVTEPPCDSGEFELALGDSPDDADSVSVARRAVSLDDRRSVILYVRVWT